MYIHVEPERQGLLIKRVAVTDDLVCECVKVLSLNLTSSGDAVPQVWQLRDAQLKTDDKNNTRSPADYTEPMVLRTGIIDHSYLLAYNRSESLGITCRVYPTPCTYYTHVYTAFSS